MTNQLLAWTDGSIEGGHAVGGWVLRKSDGRVVAKGTIDLGSEDVTNNRAEYAAVVDLLDRVLSLNLDLTQDLIIHSDSKLLVEQVNDKYKCRNAALKKYRDRIWEQLELYAGNVEFKWVPREQNQEADAISRSLYNTGS